MRNQNITMKRRKKTMTKILKIAIVAVLVCMFAVFFAVSARLEKTGVQGNAEILQLQARKDDLINEQQRLESMISTLNRTLDTEMQKQGQLYAELKATQEELGIAANRTVTVTVQKEVPVIVPAPAPATPKPRPTTRAS